MPKYELSEVQKKSKYEKEKERRKKPSVAQRIREYQKKYRETLGRRSYIQQYDRQPIRRYKSAKRWAAKRGLDFTLNKSLTPP
jgi:hypothetical protein